MILFTIITYYLIKLYHSVSNALLRVFAVENIQNGSAAALHHAHHISSNRAHPRRLESVCRSPFSVRECEMNRTRM